MLGCVIVALYTSRCIIIWQNSPSFANKRSCLKNRWNTDIVRSKRNRSIQIKTQCKKKNMWWVSHGKHEAWLGEAVTFQTVTSQRWQDFPWIILICSDAKSGELVLAIPTDSIISLNTSPTSINVLTLHPQVPREAYVHHWWLECPHIPPLCQITLKMYYCTQNTRFTRTRMKYHWMNVPTKVVG